MQLERELRPEAYGQRRGGLPRRRRTLPADAVPIRRAPSASGYEALSAVPGSASYTGSPVLVIGATAARSSLGCTISTWDDQAGIQRRIQLRLLASPTDCLEPRVPHTAHRCSDDPCFLRGQVGTFCGVTGKARQREIAWLVGRAGSILSTSQETKYPPPFFSPSRFASAVRRQYAQQSGCSDLFLSWR
jgi:hypothetical protein